MIKLSFVSRLAVFIGPCAAIVTASLAHAQTARVAPGELDEVLVTGSRVITNGNDAPTPVTVVNVEDLLTAKPTSVFENLTELPMFSGSRGVAGAPVVTGPANANSAALNLRNLGGQRALVLFDGHRMPPTSADGYVDPNMLPQMLLQRVDVVTGGASAVYGSDAVTGVVNFIVDRQFNGVKANLQRGISTYNDAGSYQVGIAGGLPLFNGRGHLEGSYQHNRNSGILDREAAKAKRAWLRPDWTLQGDGTAANPWHLQDNVRIVNTSFGGLIVCPTGTGFTPAACPGRPLVGQTFDDNGVLTPFQFGSSTGLTNSTLRIGGDGALVNASSLASREKVDQIFLRFDYDISDALHAYVSASGTERNLFGYLTNLRNIGQGWSIGACNAFLSQAYQTQLGCTAANAGTANEPTFRLTKYFDTYAPGNTRVTWDNYERNYFAIGGLEGKFGNGYRWEAAVTHSKTVNNVRAPRNNNQANTFAALDATVNQSGQVVCRVTLTHPDVYPGCVPINVFGPTAPSAEAMNYVLGVIEFTAINKLTGVSGSVAGAPFNTWAGPFDMALSGEYRRQDYQLSSSSLPTDYANCTGLRFGNCVQGTTAIWLSNNAARSPVKQEASEAAIEFNAPLLKEVMLVNELDLNAAARYTRYNSNPGDDPELVARSINATTWKAGLTWDVLESLTVRWTRSRDMRAPNLYDLYAPVSVNPRNQNVDYLLPGTPTVNTATASGGNPFLQPEISHTSTLGVVWRPSPDFSVAVDGYDITIKDALANINGSAEPVQRACYASGGTSPLCTLMERPFPISNTSSANALTKVYTRRINVAEQKTWGIDFETNWKTRTFNRPLNLRTLVTYQPHLIYSQPPLTTQDQAGASLNNTYGLQPSPVWRATVFVRLGITDALAVDVSERWRSRLRWSADPDRPYGIGGVASVGYTNVNVSYDLPIQAAKFNVFFNVQNVFNKAPPAAGDPGQQIQPGSATNGFLLGDDVVGRYYSVGVRLRY